MTILIQILIVIYGIEVLLPTTVRRKGDGQNDKMIKLSVVFINYTSSEKKKEGKEKSQCPNRIYFLLSYLKL